MSKFEKLRKLRVAEPCSENWNEMFGNDRVRFCSHCAKSVNDISAMSPKDALRLVRRSRGNICVRYVENPLTKEPVIGGRLYQIARRAPALAAGVVGATLSLSAMSYAQGQPRTSRTNSPQSTEPAIAVNIDKEMPSGSGTAVIWGTVTDPSGAVIPGATVILLDADGNEVRSLRSGYDGTYRFEGVPAGKYSIRSNAEGFTTALIMNVELEEGSERMQPLQLEIGEWVVMGVVAMTTTTVTIESELARAVDDEDLELVGDLLARGVFADEQESDGSTALFVAVRNGNTEIARRLILFGANADHRNETGENVLFRIDGDTPEELFNLLIENRADVNAANRTGRTPLLRAAEDLDADVVRLLLTAGADVRAKDENGWTALMHAAFDDDLEKVRMLVEAGSDIHVRDKEGENVLDQVADEKVEAYLISLGATRTMPNRFNKEEEENEEDGEDN
ncbi:MAG TPA: ankyrin repeat domain-containing protein [Pyrinomonadaceae bacterium]|nr:ankyrin repeat domain-containing protein [Pyrinomonadaceae bacterium]